VSDVIPDVGYFFAEGTDTGARQGGSIGGDGIETAIAVFNY
jgi:hypothetical protein